MDKSERVALWRGTRVPAAAEARRIAEEMNELSVKLSGKWGVNLLRDLIRRQLSFANRLSRANVIIDTEPEDWDVYTDRRKRL